MMVCAQAMAAVPTITVVDPDSGPISASQTGFESLTGGTPSIGITQATLTNAAHVDFDGWYTIANPLAPGVTESFLFNIYEPGGTTTLSDTWELDFIGESPGANGGGNNMRVIAPYFSASLTGAISPLAGPPTPITMNETDTPQLISELGADFIFTSGPTATPEPGTLMLLGAGLVGFMVKRKKFKLA